MFTLFCLGDLNFSFELGTLSINMCHCKAPHSIKQRIGVRVWLFMWRLWGKNKNTFCEDELWRDFGFSIDWSDSLQSKEWAVTRIHVQNELPFTFSLLLDDLHKKVMFAIQAEVIKRSRRLLWGTLESCLKSSLVVNTVVLILDNTVDNSKSKFIFCCERRVKLLHL